MKKEIIAPSGEKVEWKPGTMIYPLPAALISCGATEKEYNVLTASWVGTICSNPPMCYVSIRPERYSHAIVERNMAFVINLTTVLPIGAAYARAKTMTNLPNADSPLSLPEKSPPPISKNRP